MKRIVLASLLCVCIFSGCTGEIKESKFSYQENTTGVWDVSSSPINGAPLSEDKSVYLSDSDGAVSEIYLTVKKGKNDTLQSVYTFDMLNGNTDSNREIHCDVIFQEGKDGKGPSPGMYGYSESIGNGTLEVKGNITKVEQRSYQIKLNKKDGDWNGVSVINLYKNLSDLSRMKNKLGFDAVEKLQDLAGLRTRFVHLYVKDLSGAVMDSEFVDKGLYTYIEQPNTSYLKSRGFSQDGSLYKAKNFDFSRNAETLKNFDDPMYDESAFESVLTIRESKSHEALLKMLNDVNNPSKEMNAIIKAYFNEENLLTYAALNVLLGNEKCTYDNYLLCNPQNSNTWYLIPSDFGDILKERTGAGKITPPDSFIGLSMLYNNVLFRRYFSKNENVEKLRLKIEELHTAINADFIKKQTELYKKNTLKILYSMPDLINLPKAAEYVERYIDEMPLILEDNYRRFQKNVINPLPPYITRCEAGDGLVTIEWLSAGEGIQYTVSVSKDTGFLINAYNQQGIPQTFLSFPQPENGQYYVRVTAVDSLGKTQDCANLYTDPFGDKSYGLAVLTVG